MILKVIGGIMILSACGVSGIAAANKYSLRPKDIRRFRASIQMLETEIIYGCTPLPHAFNNISAKVEGPLKNFYSMISDELNGGCSYNLDTTWSKGVNKLVGETFLKSADKDLIAGFGKVLGSSDREDQKKHFELFYIQLKQHEEVAEEERRKNEKMYKTLGFLSGLVIFILLV
ncbi:MAG: stage sporulation protein SpoAB [Clostridia bacterium]|jgi:stage III sporulation protein AB|nr:stage sporulation protein SpoAB [Clostridia bacterium]